MASVPRVVAVVAHYKGGAAAVPALEALLGQDLSLAGLVVVDDGGGGPEADAVEQWLGQPRKGTWTAMLRQADNRGPASAFAAGIEAALARGAEHVWLSDQDMRPDPDCLRRLVEALQAEPRASAATPRRTDPATGLQYRDYALAGSRLRRVRGGTAPAAFVGITVFSGLLLRDPRGALPLVPRDYFIDSDDFAFTLRLSREQGPLLAVPRARALHACGDVRRHRLGWTTVHVPLSAPWRLYYRARNQWRFARLACGSAPAAALLYVRTFAPVAAAHLLYQRPTRGVWSNLWAGWRDARRAESVGRRRPEP